MLHSWLPFSTILVNGIAASLQFTDRLLSVTITDEIGMENDTCEFEVDDRDNLLPLLNPGDKIIPILGALPTGGIAEIGIYTVESAQYSEPPKTWSISCQAVDFINTTIGHERTKTYKQKTIKEIADEIASRQNTTAQVDKELQDIKIEHFNQNQQSDLDALNEVAKKYGAVATIKKDVIIVKKPFNGKDIMGAVLSTKIISYKDVSNIKFEQQKRDDAEGITASCVDEKKAGKTKITVGNKEKSRELKEVFHDEKQAEEAAKAALIRANAAKRTLSFTMPAMPSLTAEMPIIFKHSRAEISGLWITSKVTHKFTKSGYSCDIECLTPLEFLKEMGVEKQEPKQKSVQNEEKSSGGSGNGNSESSNSSSSNNNGSNSSNASGGSSSMRFDQGYEFT